MKSWGTGPTPTFSPNLGSSAPVDQDSISRWVKGPKFGNNADRKTLMDALLGFTGSSFKAELKTW